MTRTAATSALLHPLLAQRWSPRGFDADHALPDDQLRALGAAMAAVRDALTPA